MKQRLVFTRHGLRRRLVRLLVLQLPLAIFLIWTVAPMYWILNTALKPTQEIFTFPLQYFPRHVTLDNFIALFQRDRFMVPFNNSILVSLGSTAVLTVIIALAGYGYSRFKFRGKQLVLLLFLCTQMLPAIMLVLPLFVVFRDLGLLGSQWALVIAYVTIHLPFCTFMMMGFYNSIPDALDEAAMIDGCNRIQALWKVILPLALPGLMASATFGFISAWNEMLFALMFINRGELQTIPPALLMMNNEFITEFGLIAAAGVMALLPIMVMFSYFQRYLTGGLTAGAVKG